MRGVYPSKIHFTFKINHNMKNEQDRLAGVFVERLIEQSIMLQILMRGSACPEISISSQYPLPRFIRYMYLIEE